MALQKQNYSMNFGQGLDLKTDVNQVAPGKFIELQNAVFKNGGGLQKRNGFGNLTTLANAAGKQLTTLNGNLLATGSVLQSYSQDTDQFLDQGNIQPLDIRSQSLTRNSTSQSNVDMAIAPNNLVCTVYSDASVYYYQITDNTTGMMVVGRTALPSGATNARVFSLGNRFILTYLITITATPTLQYIAISMTAPASPAAAVTISSQVKAVPTGYDCVTVNNNLFIAWNASDVGDAVRICSLTSTLVLSSSLAIATAVADLMAITADLTTTVPTIWLSFYKSSTTSVYNAAVSSSLVSLLGPTLLSVAVVARLTNAATDSVCTTFMEITNTYSFSTVASNYIYKNTMTVGGTAGTASVVIRSVGLASKAFYNNDTVYMLTAHGSAYQPTYFIIDSSGNIYGKLSYSNGGGYLASQVLPNVTAISDVYYVPHQIKDLLVSVNKSQGTSAPGGIYTQTGLNMASFEINNSAQYTNEIARTLQLTGGIVWMYDGIKPVEHSFLVWPEDLEVNTSTTGGLLTAQQYYYQFCYEWTDSQGNLHRSAPSLPIGVTTTGATSSNTISVPTLRLTYKTGQNPVRIVGYRWSTSQQNYYQFTSVASPSLNNISIDSIDIVDTLADSSIIGNTLLYTTGGVVENISAPAAAATALYKSRQFILDAENRNVIWYSKQVIQNVPVEFSDLFTIYIPPTTGAQGSTGDVTALSAMDDKLIIFKQSAIYYVTGIGPDNTGANNDFSEPVYITGTVGTLYPNSVVFTPQGIMFKSDKGIWLLGRDLSTKYVGADVEAYNNIEVISGLVVPGTNEVRFTLASGDVLMYDYYYNQWGTFSNVPAISSTLYQGKHTYLNSYGEIRQETPGAYLDGSKPVLLKFKTAWLKLTGLQGYQRVYFLYLLSNYITPYKLNVQIGFDYKPSIAQTTMLTPINTYNVYGDEPLYGSGVYGGDDGIDQRRVFLQQQKCQSIQLTISEVFDSSQNVIAGAGLTMSGVNFIVGAKDNKPKLSAAQSAG